MEAERIEREQRVQAAVGFCLHSSGKLVVTFHSGGLAWVSFRNSSRSRVMLRSWELREGQGLGLAETAFCSMKYLKDNSHDTRVTHAPRSQIPVAGGTQLSHHVKENATQS